MAAGIIQGTVTTTPGETVELSWLVDDTVTPTKWWNVAHLINSAGNSAAFGSGANGATVPRFTVATDDVLMASLATKLDTLHTDLGTTLHTDLATTLAAFVDGLETLVTSSNTKLDTLHTDLTPTNSASVAVTLTRTADTNVYAANDIVGAATGSTAALTFANMGASGSRIMITGCSLEIDATAIISGETSYDLHLYNVTPPSALGDNAAFDLPSGDRTSYLGKISLGAPADLGSTLFVETQNINKQIKLSGAGLFAYLVTVGGYTPTSGRVYVITLHAVQL